MATVIQSGRPRQGNNVADAFMKYAQLSRLQNLDQYKQGMQQDDLKSINEARNETEGRGGIINSVGKLFGQQWGKDELDRSNVSGNLEMLRQANMSGGSQPEKEAAILAGIKYTPEELSALKNDPEAYNAIVGAQKGYDLQQMDAPQAYDKLRQNMEMKMARTRSNEDRARLHREYVGDVRSVDEYFGNAQGDRAAREQSQYIRKPRRGGPGLKAYNVDGALVEATSRKDAYRRHRADLQADGKDIGKFTDTKISLASKMNTRDNSNELAGVKLDAIESGMANKAQKAKDMLDSYNNPKWNVWEPSLDEIRKVAGPSGYIVKKNKKGKYVMQKAPKARRSGGNSSVVNNGKEAWDGEIE